MRPKNQGKTIFVIIITHSAQANTGFGNLIAFPVKENEQFTKTISFEKSSFSREIVKWYYRTEKQLGAARLVSYEFISYSRGSSLFQFNAFHQQLSFSAHAQ